MKKTRNILMFVYWLQLLAAAIIYVCGDYLEFDMAVLASDEARHTGYYVQMVMILLTLGFVPLALRLFKFRSIHASLLAHPAKALMKWGGLRVLILGLLLFANTLLYYVYGFEPTYGYLAVMVMLTMPFVLPTMGRCKAETEEPAETKEETEPEEA
jgi:hypothetical protein